MKLWGRKETGGPGARGDWKVKGGGGDKNRALGEKLSLREE